MCEPRETYTDPRAPPSALPSELKKRRVKNLYHPLKVTGLAQLSNLAQKCDAKRPCETCIQAKRAPECIYDDDRRPYPAGARLLCSTGSHLLESQLGDTAPVEISTPASMDGMFIDMLSHARSKLMCSAPDSIRLATDEPSALHHSHSSGLILVHRNSPELRISPDTTSPIDIISFLPPIISPEPWIPLSFLAPEKLQVQISDDDVSDLDMRSCVLRYESIGHKLTLQS